MGASDGGLHPDLPTPTSIRVHGGGYYDLADPDTWSGSIIEVAHGLSQVCRYGAQCLGFYSVAEHSVLVSHLVERLGGGLDLQFAGLLHDAHEAYYGDIPTPMKKMVVSSGIFSVMDKFDRVLEDELNMPPFILEDELVHHADREAFEIEWPAMWRPYVFEASAYFPHFLGPVVAKQYFLNRFKELTNAIAG